MSFIKKASLGLAAIIALGAGALAEGTDLQTQLDEANARILELEEQVEKYRPYYEQQIVAEYGTDGIIWRDDAQAVYEQAAAMYAQYGIQVDSFASEIKQSILESLVQESVLHAKAAELGYGEPDEATLQTLTEEAAADFENYVTMYQGYFSTEGATDEENRAATIDYLAQNGVTQESILEDRLHNYQEEQLYDAITGDVAVTDEDVEAKYQEILAMDKEDFVDDYSYNACRADGEVIAWNPEGYRAVKQVLIQFGDEQSQQMDELKATLETLNDELAALDEAEAEAAAAEVAEDEADEAEDAAETADEEADAEAAEEEAELAEDAAEAALAEHRSRAEIQSDIGQVGAAIEALYAELMPRAQEVVDAFNAGTDFETLIAQYNDDPGMTTEPSASQGYAVSAESTYWDKSFTEAAMSIESVGQISEPARGDYGIYIVYYLSDITPGDVALDEIREGVEAAALEEKIQKTYDDQVSAWVQEASPVYHLENF